MLDTRREIRRLIGRLEFNSVRSLTKLFACLLFAILVVFVPNYHGLSEAAQWTFFILVFAAGLWVTEDIPAFATALVLFGLMLITFTFSMFMSNTATTVMMLAVFTPVIANLNNDDPIIIAILLGIPFAANLGGMGTIIGSPPNAIANASDKITIRDFVSRGVVIGILAPVVSVLWCIFVFNNWL